MGARGGDSERRVGEGVYSRHSPPTEKIPSNSSCGMSFLFYVRGFFSSYGGHIDYGVDFYLWGIFFGLPPPLTKISAVAHAAAQIT